MNFFILQHGEQTGPFQESQVRQLLAAGQVAGGDLAWREGLAEWVPLASLISSVEAAPVAPPPVVSPVPPRPVRFEGTRNYSGPLGAGTKALIAFGAVGALLLLGFLGAVFYHLFQMKSSAQGYVSDYVAQLAPAWSSDDLMSRLTPEYRDKFNDKAMRVLFKKLALLGDLKQADAAVGTVNVNTVNGLKRVIANVDEHAIFDNGEATFHVYLVQVDGKWTIAGFHVQSPLFDKAK